MFQFRSKKGSHYSGDTELTILFIVVFFLVFLILGIVYYNFTSKSNKKTSLVFKNSQTETSEPSIENEDAPANSTPPSPTPTKKPPKPNPNDHQQINTQNTKKVGPIPYYISFNPYDPKINSNQTVTIKLRDTSPIKKVTYRINTDNTQTEPIDLKLISGTPTDGQWQGDFIINDTYDEIYYMVFEAIDSQNQTLKYEFPLR